MEIWIITVVKWVFVAAAIWLSFYHYRKEIKKINIISHKLGDSRLVRGLKDSARARMLHFLIFFSAFIIWILSYDLVNEDVKRRNFELMQELNESSQTYDNLFESQQRLVSASKGNSREVISDTKEYYSEILTSYYAMRRCGLAGKDDIFVINSALMREIALNSIPIGLRDEIFKASKEQFIDKYSEFDCSQLNDKNSNILNSYNNYIAAVREVLSATF